MTRTVTLLFLAFTLAACSSPAGAPGYGDPAYETAHVCAQPALADAASAAVGMWNAASGKVRLTVEQRDGLTADGTPGCDVNVVAQAPLGDSADVEGQALPGVVAIASASVQDPAVGMFVTHELGHLLIGSAWGGSDSMHSPTAGDLMSAHGGDSTPSADDVARLP